MVAARTHSIHSTAPADCMSGSALGRIESTHSTCGGRHGVFICTYIHPYRDLLVPNHHHHHHHHDQPSTLPREGSRRERWVNMRIGRGECINQPWRHPTRVHPFIHHIIHQSRLLRTVCICAWANGGIGLDWIGLDWLGSSCKREADKIHVTEETMSFPEYRSIRGRGTRQANNDESANYLGSLSMMDEA